MEMFRWRLQLKSSEQEGMKMSSKMRKLLHPCRAKISPSELKLRFEWDRSMYESLRAVRGVPMSAINVCNIDLGHSCPLTDLWCAQSPPMT